MAKILVTGGCGYIGSHTVVDLISAGYEVISLDNYTNSDVSVLEGIYQITKQHVKNYAVDLLDKNALEQVFQENPDIDSIIHFAALKSVNESVNEPFLYYSNNIAGLLNLIDFTLKYNIGRFIFSSSCSVYGDSDDQPVTENSVLKEAQCPYAYTKQAGERIIEDIVKANPYLSAVILRYFNPAGAHESALIGESSRNIASNLVPVITETAIGKRNEMHVYGTDYDTRDGSCIRDYIHVMDIAHAHTLAVQYLQKNKSDIHRSIIFNLGTGVGVSVFEAIQAFERATGHKLNYTMGPRREGDVIAVYADNQKAKEMLGWQPKYDIDEIMRTAWQWEQERSR